MSLSKYNSKRNNIIMDYILFYISTGSLLLYVTILICISVDHLLFYIIFKPINNFIF